MRDGAREEAGEPAEPERKTCPECAEAVLAAARRCRFCGYRFDVPLGGVSGAATGPLGRLTRRRDTTTIGQLLASWGDPLADGEEVASFGPWRYEGREGFLVVTDRRLWFVVGKSGARLFQHARASVFEARPSRRSLLVRGDGWAVELRCMGRRGETERVAALLADERLPSA